MLSLFRPTYLLLGLQQSKAFVSLSIVLCLQRQLLLAVQQKPFSGDNMWPSFKERSCRMHTHYKLMRALFSLRQNFMHTFLELQIRNNIGCSQIDWWPFLLVLICRSYFAAEDNILIEPDQEISHSNERACRKNSKQKHQQRTQS